MHEWKSVPQEGKQQSYTCAEQPCNEAILKTANLEDEKGD